MRNSQALLDFERAHTSRGYVTTSGWALELGPKTEYSFSIPCLPLEGDWKPKGNRPVEANARGIDTWKPSRTRVLEGSDSDLEKSESITPVISLGDVDKAAKPLTRGVAARWRPITVNPRNIARILRASQLRHKGDDARYEHLTIDVLS